MSNFVTPTSHKKRKIALILCIFLGLFGFHRFYVGKIGTGIIYFFTAGLFCIGWLVDLVSILMGKFKDSNDMPLIEW